MVCFHPDGTRGADSATFSDGSFIEPVNSFRKEEKKLAKLQKELARKEKYSRNWYKQIVRVQRHHHKIANIRKDFLHKITTSISKNHAVVVLEDLAVGNMSRSASGTLDAPGKNVSAKSGLNKSILDQGWYEFRRQLAYKMAREGGKLIVVPAQYTSQKCSRCGCVNKDNRKTQAEFKCIACGFECNADHNAALNILAAGQAVTACGEAPCLVEAEPAQGSS